MFGLNYLSMGVGGLAGALLCFGVMSLYDATVVYPRIRTETTAIVEAKARQQTEAAINEVNDKAERARAMRKHCGDIGLQYNSATNVCRQ